MTKKLPQRLWRGEYFRQKRVEQNLTQSDLAQALGYSSPQYVSNYERGLCDPPFAKLPLIARLLKIPSKIIIDSYCEGAKEDLENEWAQQKK